MTLGLISKFLGVLQRLPNMQSFHVRQLFNNYVINISIKKKIQPQGPLQPIPERGGKNTLILDKINISSGANVFGIKTETGQGKKQDISSVSKLHLFSPLDSFTAMYATNPNYELQEGKLQTQPTFQGVQCCIHLRKNHKVFPPKRVNDMFNYNDRYLPKVFQRVTCDSNKFYFATVL